MRSWEMSHACLIGEHNLCGRCDCECHPKQPPPFEQYQLMIRSGGGPGKITVYVIEIDDGEWIKRKVLGQELKPKGIRSRLVKQYWVVARNVYDGRTYKSGGARARAAAAALLARLKRGEPWQNRADPINQYEFHHNERRANETGDSSEE